MHSFTTNLGGCQALQSFSDRPKRLQTNAHQVCVWEHLDYGCNTDCDFLLFAQGLREALPHGTTDEALSSQSQVNFELDCRWCGADFSTWHPLPVAFVIDWMVELNRLFSAVRILVPDQMGIKKSIGDARATPPA